MNTTFNPQLSADNPLLWTLVVTDKSWSPAETTKKCPSAVTDSRFYRIADNSHGPKLIFLFFALWWTANHFAVLECLLLVLIVRHFPTCCTWTHRTLLITTERIDHLLLLTVIFYAKFFQYILFLLFLKFCWCPPLSQTLSTTFPLHVTVLLS